MKKYEKIPFKKPSRITLFLEKKPWNYCDLWGKMWFFCQNSTKFQGRISKFSIFDRKKFQNRLTPRVDPSKKWPQKTTKKIFNTKKRGVKIPHAKNGMYPGVDKNRLFWKVKKGATFDKKNEDFLFFNIFSNEWWKICTVVYRLSLKN